MKWRPDWFLLGMLVAVGLAWAFPNAGASGGWMQPDLLTKVGVALIFFLHGLTLSFAALKAGTLRWPLHLVVQICTFGFFPLIGLLLTWIAGGILTPELRLGFLYLCALPSTVSSSIAMTAAAKGNVPAAVFNATLSGLLGVFLTPLWMGMFVSAGGGVSLPLGKVVIDLVCWLLVPLLVGQLLRPLLGQWAERHKAGINKVDRGTILLLVYTSFCDSFKNGIWSEHGVMTPLIGLIGSFILFWLVLWTVWAVCSRLGFTSEDRIAAVFCGSKKTLASGVPMAKLMFGADPALSLILLPIMIYHPLQLVIGGILAARWSKRARR